MESIKIPFQHTHSAHCESGVISSLLRHEGMQISEAMAFGLAGALTLAYIPIVKIGGMPLIAYRMPPQHIIRTLSKRLGYTLHKETFSTPEDGMRALDEHLSQGQPVGLQTSVFWLPYFPREMRFHFNAHNLVAYGKQQDDYLISDPTIEQPVNCHSAALQKARFVKGMMKPRGLLYYPVNVPKQVDLKQPIMTAIHKNAKMMLKTPVPILGIRGIRLLSRKLRQLNVSNASDEHASKLFIGHIVRMQEEIGTGGAGFRFLYASFLQESAAILNNDDLNSVAGKLTETGDEWRSFALSSARMCKGRADMDTNELAEQLLRIADLEKAVFKQLSTIR